MSTHTHRHLPSFSQFVRESAGDHLEPTAQNYFQHIAPHAAQLQINARYGELAWNLSVETGMNDDDDMYTDTAYVSISAPSNAPEGIQALAEAFILVIEANFESAISREAERSTYDHPGSGAEFDHEITLHVVGIMNDSGEIVLGTPETEERMPGLQHIVDSLHNKRMRIFYSKIEELEDHLLKG